ncbi:MAG: dTDP-glucose 4,6-dehydratase [Candidatus Nealsonbacteria bacterium CG10_big_fil_rev_8_21_14_0_10_36_24]|uniref:dTDP-glucose 4,6-dehydratase n=2 Tax=Candidatus Nealsoniibacteriota TaxID=1817911 RepID=A0A2H0YNM2_9BACT|nr:MAG: dTDP-glucose 4,6-dehydratase [Candidatus Nealsonbacteria bacterium CG10_big_fil_rev_8_21_14_0_10_36_24]PIS40091.1 MAG: dTDP-glucose 4,6-dehydratase [Candidatus Nealsonbacteria bacterium CG08_land_8_20_14_0_20_36_22]
MKILITGGAGFIGSNFIRYIFKKHPDYKIINFDKLTYAGNLENLKDVEDNPDYKFVKGDICDKKIVDEVISEKPDAIINFAAESHVDRSISDPHSFLKTDMQGVITLLEIAKKYNIKRFIQISTDEVYGSINETSCAEKHPLNPSNPYSASKAAADLMVHSYFVTYKMPVLTVRSSNNFGPYQYPEKIIPLFITNLLEDKKVPLYGDGLNIRDWLYVLDNCEAIDLILDKGKEGEVYNVGGGNEKTNLEITRLILREMGKDESYIDYVEDRLGHDRRYSLDSSKIKETLGWQPKYNFEQSLKKTIQWYRNNEWWWKKIKSGEYLEYYKKQYETGYKTQKRIS